MKKSNAAFRGEEEAKDLKCCISTHAAHKVSF